MQTRKSVLKAIRENVTIKQYQTFSDKRKNTQRVKMWGVRNHVEVAAKIQQFITDNGLKGITVESQDRASHMYFSAPSIVLNFDNNLYCK